MGPGSLLFFLRPKSVPPFFSVAVCWYDSMNPSWSVGWAHAYETPSRSVSLFHEEGGEKKKKGDTQILPSGDRIYFYSFFLVSLVLLPEPGF
jgi:hypothetical protein